MNAGRPYIRYVPDVRCPAQSARAKYVLAYPWGAPRLRAVAFHSFPACPPSPLAAVNLLPPCNAATARAWTNVLTLNPRWLACGFRLPIRSAAARSPLSSLLIAARVPLFPTRRGLRSLRSRAPRHAISHPPGFALPAVARAPPRNPRTRAVRTSFRRSSVAGAVKRATYALLEKAHTENDRVEFMIYQPFARVRSDRADLLRIVHSSQYLC